MFAGPHLVCVVNPLTALGSEICSENNQTRSLANYRLAIDGRIRIDAVESRAGSYAVSKEIPFTPMRQRVLALLPTASGKTTAAYEIAEKLSDTRKVDRRSTASQ